LAYHYLTQDHADAALSQFRIVATRQPDDVVAAQMIYRLEHPQPQQSAIALAQPVSSAAASSVDQSPAARLAAVKQRNIDGIWTAQSAPELNIELTFQAGGRYSWKVTRQGKSQNYQGKSTYKYGILTLVEDQTSNTLIGYPRWTDQTHF